MKSHSRKKAFKEKKHLVKGHSIKKAFKKKKSIQRKVIRYQMDTNGRQRRWPLRPVPCQSSFMDGGLVFTDELLKQLESFQAELGKRILHLPSCHNSLQWCFCCLIGPLCTTLSMAFGTIFGTGVQPCQIMDTPNLNDTVTVLNTTHSLMNIHTLGHYAYMSAES